MAWTLWRDRLPATLASAVDNATRRALGHLRRQQRPDGTWIPLWFGSQLAPNDENPTYGTARVVLALSRCRTDAPAALREPIARGVRWLLAAQNADGGWGGAAGVPSSIEETGQAVQGLVAACAVVPDGVRPAIDRGALWIAQATRGGRHFPTAPIGLYFAKLWYAERIYPQIATAAALGSALQSRSTE